MGLNNPALQLEVMKNEPPNVEAALTHAIKVEAYEQSLACSGTRAASVGSYPERRPRNTYAVMDWEGSGQAPDLHRKVDELSATLTQATKNTVALVTGLERSGDFQPGLTDSANEIRGAAGKAQPSLSSTVSTASGRGRFLRKARCKSAFVASATSSVTGKGIVDVIGNPFLQGLALNRSLVRILPLPDPYCCLCEW